jgi:hypothetical protein
VNFDIWGLESDAKSFNRAVTRSKRNIKTNTEKIMAIKCKIRMINKSTISLNNIGIVLEEKF